MQVAWLEGAESEAVSDEVARILEARGAIVDEHTLSHVTFEGLDPDRGAAGGAGHAFERGGVITLVQPALEQEVEVRVRVRARATSRLFWWTVGVGVGIAAFVTILDPSPSLWFLLGIALWLAFTVAGILHLGTVPGSRAAERDLLASILEAAPRLAGRTLSAPERVKAEAAEEAAAAALRARLRGR